MATSRIRNFNRDHGRTFWARHIEPATALHGTNALTKRGVEVMNTSLDPREPYFRSKVTALMAKNTVRKTFKASPNPESAQKK